MQINEKFKVSQIKNEDELKKTTKTISCIFKTKDDIRQDFLALQIIKAFDEIFKKVGLDVFVCPYKTIPTRSGEDNNIGGIIEVIPDTSSRDQIGKANSYGLVEYFYEKFGPNLSPVFQVARENFIKSMAAYAVVCYILQIKDRHNGNILLDNYGHIIHIDFGFMFETSPGGNMKFENAEFKLTTEIANLLDGDKTSESFKLFQDLTIRAFLAVRQYHEHLFNIIKLIEPTKLPCYRTENALPALYSRFLLDKSVTQATKIMKDKINHAYKNFRTKLYDDIQWIQNRITR